MMFACPSPAHGSYIFSWDGSYCIQIRHILNWYHNLQQLFQNKIHHCSCLFTFSIVFVNMLIGPSVHKNTRWPRHGVAPGGIESVEPELTYCSFYYYSLTRKKLHSCHRSGAYSNCLTLLYTTSSFQVLPWKTRMAPLLPSPNSKRKKL